MAADELSLPVVLRGKRGVFRASIKQTRGSKLKLIMWWAKASTTTPMAQLTKPSPVGFTYALSSYVSLSEDETSRGLLNVGAPECISTVFRDNSYCC